MQKETSEQETANLRGGGLIRSLGGLWEAIKDSCGKSRESFDERILGGSEFVEAVLQRAEQKEETASRLQREGWDIEKVKQRAAEAVTMSGPREEHCYVNGWWKILGLRRQR